MENSSRVFVRGLPPNITQEDFTKHFSTVAPTTDTKLIANRRIGYIGYRDPEAAKSAVKHFNRSFIRTAKISVELARPIEEPQSRGTHRLEETPSLSHTIHARPNARTSGSISVAAVPAKRGSEVISTDQIIDTTNSKEILEASNRNDGPCAEAEITSPKRRRIEDAPEQEGKCDRDAGPATRDPGTELPRSTVEETNGQKSPKGPILTSDTDWIRSRTSRLLDLVDADELTAASNPEQPKSVDTRDAKSDEAKEEHQITAPANEGDLVTARTIEEHQITVASNEGSPVHIRANEEYEGEGTTPRARSNQEFDPKRLFVRNLPYHASTESLRGVFQQAGQIEDVHVPTDSKGNGKGYAYVAFVTSEAAGNALQTLDGRSFEGRLLHVMRASARRDKGLDLDAISHLPLKKQKHIKRKLEASSATFRWNTLYMNPDAVLSSVADRLGVPKSVILDPTSSDAAVKQAHAETNVIQETKAYFAGRGVDLDSFKALERSDTVTLVKNFPFGTSAEELQKLFEPYGPVKRILIPPSAVIAMVEMDTPGASKAAFKALAYRRFKNTVLFLEKAPKGILEGHRGDGPLALGSTDEARQASGEDSLETAATNGLTSTLFVKNLNFSTTSESMADFFKPLKGFLSARVKTYSSPKKPGEVLSAGFGFVEFGSNVEAEAALAAVNGHSLDGHNLVIRSSHKALDAAEERKRQDEAKKAASRRTKVIIKNLPFEATKKDLRALFSPYGKLRSVRVPKKFDRSTRGFGFAEFISAKEAESAMNVLQGTHLLGRRLNLEFAAEGLVDPEEEIERMQQKVGKQTESLSHQNMTSGPRKKFVVDQQEEIEKF